MKTVNRAIVAPLMQPPVTLGLRDEDSSFR
jgi:hypothetical protein